MNTRRTVVSAVLLLLMPFVLFAAGGTEDGLAEGQVGFTIWSQEGESEGTFGWVVELTERFMAENPDVAIEVVHKETEALREDFQTASIARQAPELLWTVNDQAGPFVAAGLVRPVGDLFDQDLFVDAVVINSETWGIPISSGNHLMLLYNRDLVNAPPTNSDELIAAARQFTDGQLYGLVYNQIEPFWMVPWLAGFGGEVFAADGVTPNLDTDAMVDTLQFLADLKFEHGVVPPESDYGTMDTLFKEGSAAFIVNGDWSLGDYRSVLGDSLGIAPLPTITATGLDPAPYTSGKYLFVSDQVTDEQLAAIREFVAFVTSEAIQTELFQTFSRLPARLSVLTSEAVQSDPILADSARALAAGVLQPSVLEMRAVWDAMKPEFNAVLAGTTTPEAAAEAMQASALAGIEALR